MIDQSRVDKYGGTSLSTAERDKSALTLTLEDRAVLNQDGTLVLVCSGAGKIDGTPEGRKATDHAYDIVQGRNSETEWRIMQDMFYANLHEHKLERSLIDSLVVESTSLLQSGNLDPQAQARIIGLPERVKARILMEAGKATHPSLEFVLLDYDQNGMFGVSNHPGNIDVPVGHQQTLKAIAKISRERDLAGKVVVVPGFIGTKVGTKEMVTLQRGMSDGTATYWGAALYSDEVRIWSDNNGISPVDPSIIPGLNPISQLTYREAEAFAGLGAKIINDVALRPARERGVPVRILNSFEPNHLGTTIKAVANGKRNDFGVKAVAQTEGYTMITVYNMPMLKAGVAAEVESTFARHGYNVETLNDGDSCRTYAVFAKPNLGDLLLDLKRDDHPTKTANGFARVTLVGEEMGYTATAIFFSTLNTLGIKPKIFQFSDDSIIVDAFMREQYVHNVVTRLYRQLFTN